jgi:hypothetical protein
VLAIDLHSTDGEKEGNMSFKWVRECVCCWNSLLGYFIVLEGVTFEENCDYRTDLAVFILQTGHSGIK